MEKMTVGITATSFLILVKKKVWCFFIFKNLRNAMLLSRTNCCYKLNKYNKTLFPFHTHSNIILFSSSLNLGGCQTKDSDACLQASPGWDTSSTCQSSTYKCKSWGKDMMRCCPESCTSWYIDQGDFEVLGSYTGIFKEKDCETFGILNPFSNGTCTYPNEAQCSVGKLPSIP